MKKKSYLLATDLDNTLAGDPAALTALFEFHEESKVEPALIYVTGRHLDSALQLMEEEQLPLPDLWITDVGTSIYEATTLEEDSKWHDWVNENWQPSSILRVASRFPFLHRQDLPHTKRISFTVEPEHAESVHLFETGLKSEGIPHHFVFSSDRDVDLLPERSGKGAAVDYALRQYAAQDVNVLLAGDSGNDAQMLSLPYPAVIVGNAQQELDELPTHPLIYRATTNFAGGIQEAWDYFYDFSGIKKPIG
ncbi:HAD-IIB family hydrolase [Sporosarcina sp. FSL K6-3508]|uniref:HAD-IIB family hydrolase n=1 Tax=Sporosarcina sp. FSL K6-3508 TaxID=2921557 RepID=UPI00315AD378